MPLLSVQEAVAKVEASDRDFKRSNSGKDSSGGSYIPKHSSGESTSHLHAPPPSQRPGAENRNSLAVSLKTDEFLECDVDWNLDEQEITTRRALECWIKIKVTLASMAPMGLGRGRIALTDNKNMWFLTTTGAFSPVSPLAASTLETQIQAFRATGDVSPLIIPDIKKFPKLCEHPSVVHRPYLMFYAGAPMVSHLGKHPHLMGVVFSWCSARGEDFSEEGKRRLVELAEEAAAALQCSLVESLDKSAHGADAGTPRELPKVWVDLQTPEWEVAGVNMEWEDFTGIELDTLLEYQGLLNVLMPAEGGTSKDLQETVNATIESTKGTEVSIPLILSPTSDCGSSLQFVVALRLAEQPPPLSAESLREEEQRRRSRSSNDVSVTGADASNRIKGDLWVVEIHARVQADTHKSEKTFPLDLVSSKAASSNSGGSVASFPTTTATGTGDLSSSSGMGSREFTAPSVCRSASVPPRLASLHFGPKLGSGSYAQVYAGTLKDRTVAIKVIEIPGKNNAADEWAAHYEALLVVDMVHDNVVKTYDWCKVECPRGWQVWIVQELCDHGPLSGALSWGVLRRGGDPEAGPDVRAVLETAVDIARGMRYLHASDEVHADLSSNNVMLTTADNSRGFVAKVTDFGLSRLGARVHCSCSHGTVSHMPPEVFMTGEVGKITDIFSFGVLLWELWTGKRAWEGATQGQVIFAVSCRNERQMLPDNAHPELAALAAECVATDPQERPSFEEIVPRLEAMLEKLPERRSQEDLREAEQEAPPIGAVSTSQLSELSKRILETLTEESFDASKL